MTDQTKRPRQILCSECRQLKPGPGVLLREELGARRICTDCDQAMTARRGPTPYQALRTIEHSWPGVMPPQVEAALEVLWGYVMNGE